MNALRINQLNKSYTGFQLKDVSFEMEEGKIMGLIGKNGAGKSTIIKSVLNMVKKDSGEIDVLGFDFYNEEQEWKQEIGVVLGGIDFYNLKKLSTITNVTKRFYKNWDEKTYQKYMKYFELDEKKKVKELSNGMKVKYLLTLALSHQAKLLIFDEPTSGLDPVSRDELIHLFQTLVKDKTRSILFSTHIISDLEKCADDITYIQKGKVLTSCDKETFIKQYQYLKEDGEETVGMEDIMVRLERRDGNEEFIV